MSTISGKDGKVLIGATALAEITDWTFRATSNNQAYASSSTGGYRKRVPGVKDGSGTIGFKLDPADPITDDLDEGAAVTLLLYLDATHFYTVPAVIDAIHLAVDITSGDVLGGTAMFSASGAWTKPNYA
ncbi:MAG: hypothetical protein HYX69_18700 [Planctomycetia bacterium]|nr:hypothetical protein [Planctomycetia bacterium]